MVTNQRKSTSKLPKTFFFFLKELAFSNFALSRNNSLCQAVRRDQTKNLQLRVLLQYGQWMLFLVQNYSLGLVTAKWDWTVENCTAKNHSWPNSFPTSLFGLVLLMTQVAQTSHAQYQRDGVCHTGKLGHFSLFVCTPFPFPPVWILPLERSTKPREHF